MAKRVGLAILIAASMCTTADAQRLYRRYATPVVVPAIPVIAPPIVVQPVARPFARGFYRPGVRAIRRSSTVDVTIQLPGVVIGGPFAPITYVTPPAYGVFDSASVYYPTYGYPQYANQYNGTFAYPYGSVYPNGRRVNRQPRVQNTIPAAQMQQVLSSPPAGAPKVLPGQFQSALSGDGIQPVSGQLPPSATQSLILQPTPGAEPLPPAKPDSVKVAKPIAPARPADVPADPTTEPEPTDVPPAPTEAPQAEPAASETETDLPPVIPSTPGK